jgi:hypothetical protein
MPAKRTAKRGPANQIEVHPERAEIDKAIVEGVTQKEISRRFGVPQPVISRYVWNSFARTKVQADIARDVSHGNMVLAHMMRMLETLEKMRQSLMEYLQDPNDPSKFWVGPRATEIDVVYDAPRANEAGVYRERTKLSTLLEEIRDAHPEFEMVEVNVKTADARKLLLDVVNSTAKQLQLWIDTELAASQVKNDEAVRSILDELVPLLLEEADDKPELKPHVTRLLRKVKKRLIGFD